PVIGGALVERASWPAVFWSRAPLVLAALALSWLIPTTARLGSVRGFDAIGAALLVTWLSALLLVFAVGSELFGLTLPLGLALLALLAFAAFLIREARHPQPLIRLSLFRDANFTVMGLSLLLQGVGLGLFQVAYADLVTATLPPEDRGVAGSLTILTRTIGVVGGATGLSAAFHIFETTALSAGAPAADAFLAGFQATFFYAAVALALCLAMSMVRPRI